MCLGPIETLIAIRRCRQNAQLSKFNSAFLSRSKQERSWSLLVTVDSFHALTFYRLS